MTNEDKKEAQKRWNRTWYLKHKGRRNEINKEQIVKRKQFVHEYKLAHPCLCGESDPRCLQFHHLDPSQKELEISNAIRNSWAISRLKKEMAKCEVMCANCHLKFHNRN